MSKHLPYNISNLNVLSNACLIATSMVARQLKNTMATTVYGAFKVPFFRVAELYFKIDYINGCRLNICLF